MSAKTAAPAAPQQTPVQPPDEQFWQRYSPHGEAPMSFAGSLTLHVLVGGILLLAVLAVAAEDKKASEKVPVGIVKLGGGGGHFKGKDKGSGVGDPDARGQESGEADVELPGLDDTVPPLPQLNDTEVKEIKEKFKPEDARYIEKSNNKTARAMAQLNENLRKKITPGDPRGGGQGGPGSGGGKDKGKDKGVGDRKGDGKSQQADLTKREKRMLRWHMRFTASTGSEYVKQLEGLGAILAFPVKEKRGEEPEYGLVRDLKKRPAKLLLNENLENLNRIYWIDDNPKSVRDVTSELRLSLSPRSFVAFMPEKLEKELFDMERSYVENVLKRKFDEDLIDETHFKVERKGGKYQPELLSVTMSR